MTNLDVRPDETLCHPVLQRGPVHRVLEPRDVPLGGLRAMRVSRTLPQRDLPLVGAWCFLDRFGPDRTDMRVLPHPHTGLQTVTWPLTGEIHHRDSLGSDVVVRPGELNLMTAGHGIAHSEMSLGDGPLLDGVQLWVALPASAADGPAAFAQHRDLPRVSGDGLVATVLVGELGGAGSAAVVHTPLLGADVEVAPGAVTQVGLRPDFEHAVLVLAGDVTVDGAVLPPGPLLYLGAGRDRLGVASGSGGRFLLLGGEPFADEIVMWWNFVGRSHDEVARARHDWEHAREERFGVVDGHDRARIPAPELPNVHLTPRRRRAE
ncbi:pirin family protein [Cellulomonas cellasea]|uniref:Pirin n=1 Tax=Cellulomonas cellasea TaxID=43670 RepID=A0A7W4UD27_9CELL|nr:pirin family protein [Cellulomonas cellasea]MBB2921951.1 hypothetical protein [Cellulomonas cellasea]